MEEKSLVQKMRDNYGYFGGMSILYGVLFAFCVYSNVNGITFPVYVLATIGFSYAFLNRLDIKIEKTVIPYAAGMVLLGVSNAMTQSEFLILFNWAGIILLFLTAMIHQFYIDKVWTFLAYVVGLLKLFWDCIRNCLRPFADGREYLKKGESQKKRTVAAICIGILTAAILLVIILPLLLKSDMVFAGMFQHVLQYINIFRIVGIAFTVIVGFISLYAVFSALCLGNLGAEKEHKIKSYNPVTGITFTGILAAVYVLYCSIQIVYLFAGMREGLPMGVTYSEYARQGFFELLFVSIINFIMVLVCMILFTGNKVLSGILTVISGCTFIMIVSAAYRMLLYVGEYHLTFLRVLVLWFLAVLAFIMVGVVVSIYRRKFRLFQYITLVVGCGYIIFSLMRPDYIIAKYNVEHIEYMSSQDMLYMIDALSDDAAPAVAQIDPETVDRGDTGYSRDDIVYMMRLYFEGIEYKNKDLSIREINYSKSKAKSAADVWLRMGEE